MYSAQRVANFIINECNRQDIPITNLKLQKLLYFIQGEFAKLYDKRLIADDFYAWQLGPVVPEVYYKFAIYSSSHIPMQKEQYGEELSEEVEQRISALLPRYIRMSTWDLVDLSHEEDPWKYAHQIFGDKTLIPYESIYQFFREGHGN